MMRQEMIEHLCSLPISGKDFFSNQEKKKFLTQDLLRFRLEIRLFRLNSRLFRLDFSTFSTFFSTFSTKYALEISTFST
jgi:hypothetical protein